MKKYILLAALGGSYIGQQAVAQTNLRTPKTFAAQAKTAIPRYLDPSVPIEERITDLLPRLTLEEKIIQLSDSWGSKSIPRLKVPALLKTEGLHGQSYSTGATIFPHGIAMAATFNTDLVQQVGKTTAIESKAANLRASWSPVLDVARDARWGRVEETYGEDPFLVTRMGVAWINGFQGENMIAVPKHFAGHGEPRGGRDSHDAGLSDRTMRKFHLEPFRAAIREAHAGGVMAAYSGWEGVPDNASGELLQQILREEWDFDGIVVSDCGGPEQFLSKHSIVGSLEEASARAVLAGVDIECGSANVKALRKAIEKGLLQEADLDVNLRRVFRAKFKLGLFENPGSDKMVWEKLPAYDLPEHRALAREVAIQSTVLLKNDGVLPLSKSLASIAVIGPNANVGQTGDYSGKASPGQVITVLEGIKTKLGAGVPVLYAKGCDHEGKDSSGFAEAVNIARQASVVVLVVGDNSPPANGAGKQTTGENVDGATLEFPGVQRQLIKAIQATGKPIVLVLVNGKPITLAWENDQLAAILETWYPGEEGGHATADIIFGDRNPSGRLPITFPRHTGQLPLNYNYETSGRKYAYYDMPFTPLYRFGHGLSYTQFTYENLKIVPQPNDPGFVTVTVDITNTGARDGEEIAQLYLTDVQATVITPVIELKGFKKVTLAKGEKKTVSFALTPYDLSLLDIRMLRTLEAGAFRVHVGGVSPEPPVRNDFHKQYIGFSNNKQGISGEFTVPVKYAADFQFDVKLPATAKAGESFPVTVTVKNAGNLTDRGEVKLYEASLIGTRRFELDKAASRTLTFSATLYKSGRQTVTVMLGDKVVTRPINVVAAPARLIIQNERTLTGNDGILHYTAVAVNTGSVPYKGKYELLVDNVPVASKTLQLDPGASQPLVFDHTFTRPGAFTIKAGAGKPRQLLVPGGISLALQDPLISLSFDEGSNSVLNAVTGQALPVSGSLQLVAGKTGNGFRSADKNTFISAGNADIYRKPFTLAAWVNIASADNGQAMFFGGKAPMGADVDITGTILAVGIQNQNPLFSFQNRDVKGAKAIPLNKWVHLAYTYDPKTEMGSVYVDGKLDKTAAQKPYAGPLEVIGGAPRFTHGNYILDEVLVTRSCLEASAIKQLATYGLDSLNSGQVATPWRPVSDIASLQTWAEVPAGSRIELTLEYADAQDKVVSSQQFVLKSGKQILPVERQTGSKVRMRVKLVADKWNALPVLQSAVLSGKDTSYRWAFADDWQQTAVSGAVQLLKN